VLKTLGFSGPAILGRCSRTVLLALLGGIPGLAIRGADRHGAPQQLASIAPRFLRYRRRSSCKAWR